MQITKTFLILMLLTYLIIGIGCENMRSEKDKNLVITAHRGASGLAPENTLAAVKKAMEIGADYSEIDVHLSKDGQVVLLHDETLERTTNDSGAVYSKTMAELNLLDAGGWFGPTFRGEPLPSLEDVMKLVLGKMKLNIEIKISGNEPDIADKVVHLVGKNNFVNECIITSFDEATVRKVKEINKNIKTGFIIGDDYEANPFKGDWEIISTNYKNVNKQFMENASKAKKQVQVWTVNETNEMERLIDLKVDGIITNYPNILKDLLKMSYN